MTTETAPAAPPRENVVRSLQQFDLKREDDGTGGMPTLYGEFSRFNEWTEINSMSEGHFMERVTPGAYTKTFKDESEQMRILFDHGTDPHIGNKVLAPITKLRETPTGAYYEGTMLDTDYNRELIPGLEAGQYGASMRFRVVREEWRDDPGVSEHNPNGLPERSIKEAAVLEFGPVTFGAYPNATAGVRSLTDEFIYGRAARQDPQRLAQVLGDALRETPEPTPPEPTPQPVPEPVPPSTPGQPTSTHARTTKEEPVSVDIERFATMDDLTARRDEVQRELEQIVTDTGTRGFDTETEARFESLGEEKDAIEKRMAEVQRRLRIVGNAPPEQKVPGTEAPERDWTPVIPERGENIYDLTAIRQKARDGQHEAQLVRDNARKAIDQAVFPHTNQEDAQAGAERLLVTADTEDADIARHMLATGSERYARAFGKYLGGRMRTSEEEAALERALSLTGASGGFAVPFTLDPTIIPTSNGAVNPMRAISRVEQITGDEWRGVSSAGITAAYAAEATETTDNAPTLAQPTVTTEKAQAFVPFSIEVGMDWTSLQAEMGRLLQDAKDELEAVKFLTGTGTNEPFGVITGSTNSVNAGAGGTFTIANLYALFAALPPRFRSRARTSVVANQAIFNSIRQFDTTGGSSLWIPNLTINQMGSQEDPRLPEDLLGFATYEASAMSAVTTVGAKFLIIGDFRYFLIADRIGLTVEVMPHLVGTNHRPTGQRGLYAYWRNGSKVLDAAAFRHLLGLA